VQSLEGSQQLTITIINVNDHSHVFLQRGMSASLLERLPASQLVAQLNASDQDPGSVLTYQILSGGEGLVSLDNETGRLSTSVVIDRESLANTTLNISVEVSDGERQDATYVLLTIGDVNDNAPVLTSARNFSFFENASVGDVIGLLLASDADVAPNDAVVFDVTSFGSLTMVNLTTARDGSLVLTEALDFEQRPAIVLPSLL
jgi:hypothetical protein